MSYLCGGGGGGGGGILVGPPSMRMAMMPPFGSFFGLRSLSRDRRWLFVFFIVVSWALLGDVDRCGWEETF
jgi:hypothetical protein